MTVERLRLGADIFRQGYSGAPLSMTPVMNDSWISLERSSSDLCFVSGMSSVDRTPVNMIKESTSKLCSECDVSEGEHRIAAAITYMICISLALFSNGWPSANCATIAPSLPHAAEMPYAVER